MTGKIKKLVRDRGFGFITGEDGKDVFFHQSGLAEGTFMSLQENQQVEYQVENSDKGPRAAQVRIVEG